MKIAATLVFGAIVIALMRPAPKQNEVLLARKGHSPAMTRGRSNAYPVKKARTVDHKVFIKTHDVQHICAPESRLAPIRQLANANQTNADQNRMNDKQVVLRKRVIKIPQSKMRFVGANAHIQEPSPRGTIPRIAILRKNSTSSWAKSLPGITLHGYLPSKAWLIEATDEGLKNLYLHPDVVAVDEWRPSDKTHPVIDAFSEHLNPSDMIRLSVRFFNAADTRFLMDITSSCGGKTLSVTTHDQWCSMHIVAPVKTIAELSSSGAVQWIEESRQLAMSNFRAVLPDALNVTNSWLQLGIAGKDQVIGHADSGIDTGRLDGIHPDFTNTVMALISYVGGGTEDYDGHGTHTAGSLVGDGSASQGKIKGVAWQSKLVHQCIIDKKGYFSDFNIYSLFSDTLDYGATIHSDSWGDTGNFGVYSIDCQDTDLFVWDNPEFLPVFAAGNFGTDSNNDGVIDSGSITAPSCAKNVISVGAAENHHDSDGFSSYRWSDLYSPKCSYNADPIKSDYITTSADTENGLRGMAAFSSRGPCEDGRIKPDLVAPGSDIYSCRSTLTSGSGFYRYDLGTSMSTPLVAGCAALARQYLIEKHNMESPSAAMVKSILLNSAKSLTPGQYGIGAHREIPAATPNNVEGWGMADIERVVNASNTLSWVADRIEVLEDSPYSFEFEVNKTGEDLAATLSWTDYPGTPGSGSMLINDLDLTLTLPDGTVVFPNSLGQADRLNTVESIKISPAPVGKYKLTVSAHALPYQGAVAALALRGALSNLPDTHTLTIKMIDESNPDSVFKEYTLHYAHSQTISSPTAPSIIWVDNGGISDPYVFCSWEIDGVRQPDGKTTAANPVHNIVMNANRTATARYESFFRTDPLYGDYFTFSWWNKRYFGGEGTAEDLNWSANPDSDWAINAYEMYDYTDPRNAADSPREPSITVKALPVFNSERCPWPVIAEITDNLIVADANLIWRQKGETSWRHTPMTQLTDTLWGAYLEPTNYGNARIDYYVAAADWLQYNLNETTSSPVYSVIGDYTNPWPQLTPDKLPDLVMYGEQAVVELTLENLAGADLQWNATLSNEPEGSWITTDSALQGSLVAREKTGIILNLDSSKLPVGSLGKVGIKIDHNEPGSTEREFTVKRLPLIAGIHGVPVAWMRAHGIETDNYDLAAESDLDGDGFATWQEWHADTDPLDADSSLGIIAFELKNGTASIKWKGGVNATQWLECAASPAGGWTKCVTLNPPTGITNAIGVPASVHKEKPFFRISVPLKKSPALENINE